MAGKYQLGGSQVGFICLNGIWTVRFGEKCDNFCGFIAGLGKTQSPPVRKQRKLREEIAGRKEVNKGKGKLDEWVLGVKINDPIQKGVTYQ